MSESIGVSIPWKSGFVVFVDHEAPATIDAVLEELGSHVVIWSVNRPEGDTIDLLGPCNVFAEAGDPMAFMILRTPSRVFLPKFILWIGRINETDGFIQNAGKRSWIDGYMLIQKPYRFAIPDNN
jgi:hypothetical protein